MKQDQLIELVIAQRRCKTSFDNFKDVIEDVDLSEFNLRWLISIADTYAHRAEPLEAITALHITNYFNGVRRQDTFSLGVENWDRNHVVFGGGVLPMYDGVDAMFLCGGDTHTNMVFLIKRATREFPFLDKLWDEVVSRLKQHSPTIKQYEKIRFSTAGSVFKETKPYNCG